MSKRKSLINRSDISYLLVIALLGTIVFFQKCDGSKTILPAPKVDTVVKYVQIHDTVPGKPKIIRAKKDTIWRDSLIYVASENYDSLLLQYHMLGDKLFATTVYQSEFKLGTYGKATVIDTVRGNQLIANHLSYDIKIPEKEITITKPAKPVRQVYVGAMVTGSQLAPVRGVYVGGLYKDRKDRIFGAHVGYNREIQYSLSSYWKISFK